MSEVVHGKDEAPAKSHLRWETRELSPLSQYLAAATVVLGITLLAFFLRPLLGYRALALVYLLGVVVMALFVGRGPTLLAAAMSALLWDFCFLAPITTFRIANIEDLILFGMYFVVALVLGQLTARIRAQEKVEREREEWATALYLLTHELVEATDLNQMLGKVVQHLERVFGAKVAVLLPNLDQRLNYQAHPASTYDITGPEQPVVGWVFEHAQPAGKFTGNLPQADALFVPLTTSGRTMGVVGLSFHQPTPLTLQQRKLLDAFSQQIAILLDRRRLREESEKARLLGESERLGKNLLNSVSHEIRTPLAAIKGATGNLLELEDPKLSEPQKAIIAEIQEASERLDRLVGKVLDIARLESGRVKPNLTLCDVADVVHVALKETRRELARHKVEVVIAPGLPLVLADFVLLQQSLKNLLSNAAAHTPPGTAVEARASAKDGMLVLSVADRGRGIPLDALRRVFDKFYRAPGAPTGGTGLGLSLVKGFVEAQGGQVSVENRLGGGALFAIQLPLRHSAPEPAKNEL